MARTKRTMGFTQSKTSNDSTTTTKNTPNSDLPDFKSPFTENTVTRVPKTILDTNIMFLKQNIMGKPKWYEKISNTTILAKWKREVRTKMSPEEVQYCIDWLMYEVSQKDSNPFQAILSSPLDAVYVVEFLVSEELKKSFVKNLSVLENIPLSDRDYHPGSNNTVWDIVHPSLYCLNYDVSMSSKLDQSQRTTPLFKWIGTGEKLVKPTKNTKDNLSSDTFQWLPSDIAVDKNGKVSIHSYINNLHPYKHRELYTDLAHILERFVPIWEKVLAESLHSDVIQQIDMYNLYPHRDEPEEYDSAEEDYYENRRPNPLKLTEIFEPRETRTKIDLKGRNLQVIVKMANIELTPQNPKYEGGTWHVEGMKNENIVATGIYYYGMSNITQTNLQFRQACEDPPYEQNDTNGVEYVYGLSSDSPLNQFLGEVTLCEDRCIAFPNIYQHLVTPFKLVDPNQNGHRKILVIFLIDPKRPILSTSTILPQQSDWLIDSILQIGALTPLPKDIIRHIVEFLPNMMTFDQAKVHRTKLMDERKYIREKSNEIFLREFSLCEH
jgi:hypothetical protein